MANFNFSNFWWNTKRFFKTICRGFWEGVKFGGKLLLLLILMALEFIAGLLDWILIWNPVCFIVWSIIMPRRMALNFSHDGSLSDDDGIVEIVSALWPMIRRKVCAWHVHLLPMCLKKWFILEDTQWFSEKAQIAGYRAFNGNANALEIMKNMSKKARDRFYSFANTKEKVDILRYRRPWSIEDLRVLLSEQASGLLNSYFKDTPSQEVINELIRYCEYGNALAPTYLGNIVWKNGMSPETLKRVRDMKDEHIKNQLLKLNAVRGQIHLVIGIRESKAIEEWRRFLEETPEISKPAEREMSEDMMKVFYETGHHLHGDNILDFVSGMYTSVDEDSDEYRRLIFRNEKLSDLVMDYIKSNARIYRLYLAVKSEQKK